jgi:hypothetical protein
MKKLDDDNRKETKAEDQRKEIVRQARKEEWNEDE